MKSPNRTSPSISLETELKTLWGANAWPFTAAVQKPYASRSFTDAFDQLTQLFAVKASGVLAGELSLIGAQAAQHLARAHKELGRGERR